MTIATQLSEENFLEQAFRFRDRQAGVSVIYDPDDDCFTYNAYCVELTLNKELFTEEHEFLADALALINSEFGTWELKALGTKDKGCGSCAAKR